MQIQLACAWFQFRCDVCGKIFVQMMGNPNYIRRIVASLNCVVYIRSPSWKITKLNSEKTAALRLLGSHEVNLIKFSQSYCTNNNGDREQEYKKYLRSLLNCDSDVALKLVRNNPAILQLSLRTLKRNAEIIKESQFDLEDIVAHPHIISHFQIHRFENGVHLLREVGFRDVTISNVLRLTELFKKSVRDLKALDLIPQSVNPLEHMLSCLDSADDVSLVMFLKKQHEKNEDQDDLMDKSIYDIRISFVRSLLCHKLCLSSQEIDKLMAKHKGLCYRSLNFLSMTIDILLHVIKMPKSKVMSNGWLLVISPRRIYGIIGQVLKLGGQDIKNVVIKCPKILHSEPEDLKEIEHYLHAVGITDEQMKKYPIIFCLKPQTVKKRMEMMLKIEEFRIRMSHPRFLQLVLSEGKAKERLDAFKELKLKSMSLDLLTRSGSKGDLSITGKKSGHRECLEFLSKELKKSMKQIRQRLREHSNYSYVSLSNVKSVLELLKANGITKEQIWLGLPIVLYEEHQVNKVLSSLPQQEEAQPIDRWKNDPNFVQLLIYLLEKARRKNGGGIYSEDADY